MERLSAVLRTLATSYTATFCSVLLTLVIAPLYVRHLGLEQMGLLAIGQAIAGYLTLANGGLSTSTMILVSHAKGREDWNAVARVFRHGLLLSAAAVAVVCLLVFAIAHVLAAEPELRDHLQLEHHDVAGLIRAVGLQVMVALAFATFYDLLAGLQENHRVAVFQGANRIIGQIASAAVAVQVGTAASAIVTAACVSVLTGLICVVDTRRRHAAAFRRVPIELREIGVQLRTGAKSFSIQAGATMSGYAPVGAINQFAGPAAVPLFTLPHQIIALAIGVIGSFGAVMLPVFGEAWAKGDLVWIQRTVTKLFEKLLLLLSAAAAGFLALGQPFLQAWVQLDIPAEMLISVTAIAASTNVLSYLKFMLSGINRHRATAVSEVLNGLLCVALTLAVCRFSIEWVGAGIVSAGALTSYWLLPREIRRHVGIARIMPGPRSLVTILGIAAVVFATAKLGFVLLYDVVGAPAVVSILVAALVGFSVFLKSAARTGLLDWRAIVSRFVAPQRGSRAGTVD